MVIKFPTKYRVSYPSKNLKYYTDANKKFILKPLLESCDNYCMYCGKNICVDDKYDYNIEHSLEKSMKVDKNNFLEHCKFNMSIACHDCNQRYKTRMIDVVDRKLLKENPKCNEKECLEPCEVFYKIMEDYLGRNKIILQPNSIKSILNNYEIDYNLIKHVFEPSNSCGDEAVKTFISEHIARFHLNREMYTESVLNICEIIIRNIKIMNWQVSVNQLYSMIVVTKKRYDNILEKLFIDFLFENFSDIESLYRFCELSIVLSFV